MVLEVSLKENIGVCSSDRSFARVRLLSVDWTLSDSHLDPTM